MPYKIIIFWILTILLSSCATNKKTDTTQNNDIIQNNSTITQKQQIKTAKSLDEIIPVNNLTNNENITLQTKISFDFPYNSNSANAKIKFAKQDSILITITGPFGINVGKLYANANEFIMNNNLQSETWIGKPTDENINKIANLPLNFNDLVNILRSAPTNSLADYIYNQTNNSFELLSEITAIKGYNEQIIINNNNSIKSIVRSENNETIMNINYDNYTTTNAKQLAQKINITFPKSNGKVAIEVKEITINDKTTSPMKFQQPKSYKLINID